MAETAIVDPAKRAQALVDKLWGDKSATGAAVRKAAKEMYPDINIPDEQAEIAAAPLKAEIEDMRGQLKSAMDRLAAKEKADEDMRVETDLSVKIAAAAREFNLTDSGKAKMMERMKETGNYTDAQAAAAYVVSQMPKPAPSNSPSWLPEAANLFGTQQRDEQFEALHKDPRKYMDDQLREFSRDPDKYVADTFGTA
jgi:metal-dependent amidase/aminoacylase/carboxypeptidase family protein